MKARGRDLVSELLIECASMNLARRRDRLILRMIGQPQRNVGSGTGANMGNDYTRARFHEDGTGERPWKTGIGRGLPAHGWLRTQRGRASLSGPSDWIPIYGKNHVE